MKNNKILAINAPVQGGKNKLPGDPTSLYYALSTTVDSIHKGILDFDFDPKKDVFNPGIRNKEKEEELTNYLKKNNPTFVIISATTPSTPYSIIIAQLIKKISPDTIIITGGPHHDETITVDKDKNLGNARGNILRDKRYSKYFDFFVGGDGEFALKKLLETLAGLSINDITPEKAKEFFKEQKAEFKDVHGKATIATQFQDEYILATTKGDMIDLNLLPPLYKYFENNSRFSVFLDKKGNAKKTAHILTTRGCKNHCAYCSETAKIIGGAKSMSLNKIMNEIFSGLYTAKSEALFFEDSIFMQGNKRNIVDFCDLLIHSKQIAKDSIHQDEFKHRLATLERGCQMTVEDVMSFGTEGEQKNVLQKMQEAGCSYIFFGIESLNEDIMVNVHKHKNKEYTHWTHNVEKALKLAKDVGLNVGSSVMFGLPGENSETIKETLDGITQFVEMGLLDYVSPNIVTYHPGTEITKKNGKNIDYTKLSEQKDPYSYFEEAYEDKIPDYLSQEDLIDIINAHQFWNNIMASKKDILVKDIETFKSYRKSQDVVDLNTAMFAKPYMTEIQETLNEDPEELARKYAADIVGLKDRNRVLFGRNTTESMSFVFWLANLKPQDVILTTDIEFESVKRCFKEHRDHGNTTKKDNWTIYADNIIEENYAGIKGNIKTGVFVKELEISDKSDNEMSKSFLDSIGKDTKLIVISHVNREDGRIIDIKTLAKNIKKQYPYIYIAIDGAQALGNLPQVDFADLEKSGIDFYVGTPHKWLGAYPVGLLYFSERAQKNIVNLIGKKENQQIIMGGMVPKIYEIPNNVDASLNSNRFKSFISALHLLELKGYLKGGNDFSGKATHNKELKNRFIHELKDYDVDIQGYNKMYSPGILSFRFSGLDNHAIVDTMQRHGIFCSYISQNDSIRVSFDIKNNEYDIDKFFDEIKNMHIPESQRAKIISLYNWSKEKAGYIGKFAAAILFAVLSITYYYQESDFNHLADTYLEEVSRKYIERLPKIQERYEWRKEYVKRNPHYRTFGMEDSDSENERYKTRLMANLGNFKEIEKIIKEDKFIDPYNKNEAPSSLYLSYCVYTEDELKAIELLGKEYPEANYLLPAIKKMGKYRQESLKQYNEKHSIS